MIDPNSDTTLNGWIVSLRLEWLILTLPPLWMGLNSGNATAGLPWYAGLSVLGVVLLTMSAGLLHTAGSLIHREPMGEMGWFRGFSRPVPDAMSLLGAGALLLVGGASATVAAGSLSSVAAGGLAASLVLGLLLHAHPRLNLAGSVLGPALLGVTLGGLLPGFGRALVGAVPFDFSHIGFVVLAGAAALSLEASDRAKDEEGGQRTVSGILGRAAPLAATLLGAAGAAILFAPALQGEDVAALALIAPSIVTASNLAGLIAVNLRPDAHNLHNALAIFSFSGGCLLVTLVAQWPAA